jgi:hypothetical protein
VPGRSPVSPRQHLVADVAYPPAPKVVHPPFAPLALVVLAAWQENDHGVLQQHHRLLMIGDWSHDCLLTDGRFHCGCWQTVLADSRLSRRLSLGRLQQKILPRPGCCLTSPTSPMADTYVPLVRQLVEVVRRQIGHLPLYEPEPTPSSPLGQPAGQQSRDFRVYGLSLGQPADQQGRYQTLPSCATAVIVA